MSIVVKNLRMSYGKLGDAILDIPNWEIADGDQICIVGGSGSGKTTLLHILSGIVSPQSGSVCYDGQDIVALSEPARDRFRAREIGYVFQTFNLLQNLSALENVAIAQSFAGQAQSAAKTRARELLERVGLKDKFNSRPSNLSVGEQQRVALARAVANKPRLILADEPTANLDEENSQVALQLLREICTSENSTLVLVTHDQTTRDSFEKVIPLSEVGA